jgi:hypothetical protein
LNCLDRLSRSDRLLTLRPRTRCFATPAISATPAKLTPWLEADVRI